MRYLRKITSHNGVARYYAECGEDVGGWALKPARTPYASGPSAPVWSHEKDGSVLVLETAHKVYEVWAVGPSDIYPDEDAAYAEHARRWPGRLFVECSRHRDCFREQGHAGVCERSDGLALGSGAVRMRDGSGWIDANGYEHSNRET